MVRLLKILVGLGLLWSGYWYAAGYGLRTGIASWFATQQDRGWRAEFADLTTSGYPWHHINVLTSPALADPATGTAWQADWLNLESPAIWPGRLSLQFATTPQRLSYYDQTSVVEAEDLRADLSLRPGIALELEKLALTSGPWEISADYGRLMSGATLTLAMIQTGNAETYRYDIDVQGFTPGADLRQLTSATDALPPSFQTLNVDMQISFDRAWDRRALENRRPQPVAIDLKLADLHWGGLQMTAAGMVTVDAQGLPSGAITLKAENWREILTMAQSAWNIPQRAVDTASRGLTLLSRFGDNPDALDVQMNLRDGFVALGPIPLGPAPRLILH